MWQAAISGVGIFEAVFRHFLQENPRHPIVEMIPRADAFSARVPVTAQVGLMGYSDKSSEVQRAEVITNGLFAPVMQPGKVNFAPLRGLYLAQRLYQPLLNEFIFGDRH